MRYLLVAVVCLCLVLAGCYPQRAFVVAVDNHTAVILPEYEAYIASDPNLDESSKRIRTRSAEALRSLIHTAKVEAGVDGEE